MRTIFEQRPAGEWMALAVSVLVIAGIVVVVLTG